MILVSVSGDVLSSDHPVTFIECAQPGVQVSFSPSYCDYFEHLSAFHGLLSDILLSIEEVE